MCACAHYNKSMIEIFVALKHASLLHRIIIDYRLRESYKSDSNSQRNSYFFIRVVQKLTGDNLNIVWAEFSTLG